MDVFSEIMKQVVQVLMVPVKKQLSYLIFSTKYVRDMRTKMRELDVARQGEEDHLNKNTRSRLEISSQVTGWLVEVEKTNAKVENFPSEVGSCFNFKMRHKLGRKAFKVSEEVDSVTRQHSLIQWTDDPIPLGRVDSMKASASASTSTPTDHQANFQSREQTFTTALEALRPNKKAHMIALCGMGGVGKTTIMQRLKEVVQEKKFFNFIVKAVIGEKTDPIAIQKVVATYLGIELNEENKASRADKLRQGFKAKSDGGNNKFLIILDDVWQSVDLEDIGLSYLPNQGVNFKVLLTSRDKDVCTEMGVDADLVLNVGLLLQSEAQSLFRQFVQFSDPELQKIGEDIVSKCCGLPIAIKTMGCTLRGKRIDTWKDALARLKHHNVETVAGVVFGTSYVNLHDEETEAAFLLCGLYPEDFDIPTEELLRYGWGLELFKYVDGIREARYRLNTCIERLIHTNLLLESDVVGCVKMHDLVRSFVLNKFSKVEHASIVNHGLNTGWPENNMSRSCKNISLRCTNMSELPSELRFPNLLILNLMYGNWALRFPREFYGGMEKLQVISYDHMMYPSLPSSSHQCSTNLRVLCLHHCYIWDYELSSVGKMLNLEVLSFANSRIKSLPSTIGNLKKLRVLDVTNCGGLHIDKSIFKNIVKLEEFYAKVARESENPITITGDDRNEELECWKNLHALEFEFCENDDRWKNLSFEKLELFSISASSFINRDLSESLRSFGNMLALATKKDQLLKSGINELFEKTKVLFLSVDDMKDIEDVSIKPSIGLQSSSFRNLRFLVVSECAELEYLFTLNVAKVMSNLEHLVVVNCLVMKELIHTESSGEESVTFPNLKSLCLGVLPNLSGFCQNVNIIALPQLMEFHIVGIPNITSIYSKKNLAGSCLLREEVLIPKLETLHIESMIDLKNIWPCDFRTSEEVKLRSIKVIGCDEILDLFPCNPMPFLHHLEELQVEKCGSIEVLFNIDLDSYEKGSSSLRIIDVCELGKLREVWRIKGGENKFSLPILHFQAVQSILIRSCERFRFLFTPTTANFDIGGLINLDIRDSGETGRYGGLVENSQEQEINVLSEEDTSEVEEETSEVADNMSYILFSSCIVHSFRNLRKLQLERVEGVEVVFEIESSVRNQDNQQQILPYLEELYLNDMEMMSHVWKCNWNEFLFLQKQQSKSPFHNLTTIQMERSGSIKYLFSPLMAKLLLNLKRVMIVYCHGIEEIVSNRHDEDEEKKTPTSTHRSTTMLPHLDSLTLGFLQNLKCIGGNNELSFNSTTTAACLDPYKFSQVDGVSWSLCQYSRKIRIDHCDALSSGIPCYAAGQMQKLQVLKIAYCDGMKEVFETQGINKIAITHKFPNLKKLHITSCSLLEYLFTFSTLETLRQLQELQIKYSEAMEVIVKAEDDGEAEASSEVVVFPRLKRIELFHLPELEGFFLGKNIKLHWPSLDDLVIKGCPRMKAFTTGGSTAPQLKYVETSLGKHSPGYWFDSHVTTTTAGQETIFQSLESSTSSLYPAATSEGIPWSFNSLIELDVKDDGYAEKIIPSSALLQLQKLEKIHVTTCSLVEQVFEALEGKHTGFDESQTLVVKLPNLTQVELRHLDGLMYMWRSNRWTLFEFPNLTIVKISYCNRLEHVFTSSMIGSLKQLQELEISDCTLITEVFVKDTNDVVEQEEEESDAKTKEIILPCLRYVYLDLLSCLKGFCLGNSEFSFPLLDRLIINTCTEITTFTKGNPSTPELKEVVMDHQFFYVAGEGINSIIKMKQEEFKRNTSSLISS